MRCPRCEAVLIDSEGDTVSMSEHVQATGCGVGRLTVAEDIAVEHAISLDEAIAKIRETLGERWMP